jgi:hypothetical protein
MRRVYTGHIFDNLARLLRAIARVYIYGAYTIHALYNIYDLLNLQFIK